MAMSELSFEIFIILCTIISIAFGLFNAFYVSSIKIRDDDKFKNEENSKKFSRMIEVAGHIAEGSKTFLWQEYTYLAVFLIAFAILIFFTVEEKLGDLWTVIAFLLGGFTSIVSGYIGMSIAVIANVRTTKKAIDGLDAAFVTAFRAGTVLGFVLVGLALLVLVIIIMLYKMFFLHTDPTNAQYQKMFECIAGYGLGGSTVALFGRVGGGIYTKAADVGSDLVGKVIKELEEDDARNPGVVADNVGDNVGDIAGMGSDLFGSLAESTCAALVISASSPELMALEGAKYYPLLISATGILISIVTSFFATNIMSISDSESVTRTLKYQLFISTILMTPVIYFTSIYVLPTTFTFFGLEGEITRTQAFYCAASGLWSGLIIGFFTEYFTSNEYSPVRDLAASCEFGAAPNIIQGLAIGYLSTVVPVLSLAATIYIAFQFAGMYGIALSALGMLSTLCIALTIDAYGPISDNAGGIAEMCNLGGARRNTDILDAAGNTTAAVGKGFAIGSACLVALALFGAFVTRAHLRYVDILAPLQFSGLIIGAMLPYAFSAMTMKSVGKAANEMIIEIQRQFKNPKIMAGKEEPDYKRCIEISTRSSLNEMIAPGLLVILTPIFVGLLFGPKGVSGLLAGSIVSGVQMAIAFANSGGAWDNAKKYVESNRLLVNGEVRGKKTDEHKAAVIGDTVGDPLKDTSGPSLNILIKLMAIISLVFGGFFARTGILVRN